MIDDLNDFGSKHFETRPAKPAPSANIERSQRVKDALAEILPKIAEIKSAHQTEQEPTQDL